LNGRDPVIKRLAHGVEVKGHVTLMMIHRNRDIKLQEKTRRKQADKDSGEVLIISQFHIKQIFKKGRALS